MTVIVSPIVTGRMKWIDWSTRIVPGPGYCVPSTVEISEADHYAVGDDLAKDPAVRKPWSTIAIDIAGHHREQLMSSGRRVRSARRCRRRGFVARTTILEIPLARARKRTCWTHGVDHPVSISCCDAVYNVPYNFTKIYDFRLKLLRLHIVMS